MTAKAFAAIAAVIAIAALLVPGMAAAREPSRSRQDNATVIESISVPGSNGFVVGATLTNRSALSVSAAKFGGLNFVSASYKLQAPQAPGSEGIRASLGKLGRIDMRFIVDSVHEEEPLLSTCKGEKDKVEEGQFVGLFEFRGEDGYTKTRVRRAAGSVLIAPAPTCHHPAKHGPHRRGSILGRTFARATAGKKSSQAEPHLLGLKVQTDHPAVEFEALQLFEPGKKRKKSDFGNFTATAVRDRGRIVEEAGVLDLLVGGNYLHVPDLTHPTQEAMLEPPAPFLGSATLRRESAHQVSWVGDLRVNLPGFGVVPLAGPGTDVTLCADSGCRLTE